MQSKLSGRLEGVYTLLSPLSHIGTSIGPDSYLATQTIIGADGNPVEVFVYSGNALRGMWRDAGALYMLDKLGSGSTLQVPLDLFYLLFSGGSIGGPQNVDIDQARRIRELVPHLSVFGGGVGNMLLPGKLAVGEALPVCRELAHIIPADCPGNRNLSWRQMTTDVPGVRTDDAKNELLRQYLREDDKPQLEGPQQALLLGDGEDEAEPDLGEKSDRRAAKDRPQQMRYTVEALCRGSVLWQETFFRDMSEIELGALVAAIAQWSRFPFLGGQKRVRMGLVKADMKWQLWGAEREHFLTVGEGECLLYPPAQEAKARYDDFLRQYAGYLEERQAMLVKAIGGKVAE